MKSNIKGSQLILDGEKVDYKPNSLSNASAHKPCGRCKKYFHILNLQTNCFSFTAEKLGNVSGSIYLCSECQKVFDNAGQRRKETKLKIN